MSVLSQLQPGDTAVIDGFDSGSSAYRAKLLAMGVTPGTAVSVVRYAPMGDPIEISVRGYNLTLRRAEACVIRTRQMDHAQASA